MEREQNAVGVDLSEIREAISVVQGHDLSEHVIAYDQIHAKLEQALRSIDGQ
jgi:ADP-dependent phosphofructokinase/glucokinase